MLDSTDTLKTDNRQIHTFQPMGLGGILDATLSLYRENLRLFLGIATIYFVLIALQEGIVVFLLERPSMPRLKNLISDVDSVSDTFIYMLVVGVSVVASSEVYLGRRVTIQRAFRSFSSRFLGYLGATLIFLALSLISTLTSMDSIKPSRAMSMLMFFSFPFVLYYLIGWIFYGPVISNEKWTTGESLERSRILVRGTWGRTFGIVIAILLLDVAMYYILGNSVGIVLALSGIVGDGSVMETIGDLFSLRYTDVRPTSLEALIMYIVYLGAETFTLPIYAIGVTLLYFDLRIRKEGFDIEMQVRNSQDLM